MTDHIKGPWISCGTGKLTVRESVGGAFVAIIRDAGPIQQALGRRDLNAAAPEMLEALKAVDVAATNEGNLGDKLARFWNTLDQVRAAIAKATGEAK